MTLKDYFRGQRVELRSPLAPELAKTRINEATPLGWWPFYTGVAGRVVGRSLRLTYRPGLLDYNMKPVFAGRLEDDLGATRLSAKFRAPIVAYLFFPFWFAILSLMATTLVTAYANGTLEPDAYILFVMLPLFAIVPLAMHYIFNRNASVHCGEIASFLHEVAHFEPINSLTHP